ncbi:MAG: VOC family protein [Gammaproteobacteria bacterium]|nr:VOC family protein [Gammaproteobacteria bacterium]
MPINVLHIDHLVLIATDAERLVGFYQTVLGLELERSIEGGLYQLRAGSCLIDIVSADSGFLHAAPGTGGLDHFCLRVEPFDAARLTDWLSRHGVSCSDEQRVYGADGFGPAIYFDDPEGNTVELKGPASAQD